MSDQGVTDAGADRKDEHDQLAGRMVEVARGGSRRADPDVHLLIRALARQTSSPDVLATRLALLAADAEDRLASAARALGGFEHRYAPGGPALGHQPADAAEPRDVLEAWREAAAVLDADDGTPHGLDDHDTQSTLSVLLLDLPFDDGAERLRSRADWIESGADAGTGPLHAPTAVAAALRKVSERVEQVPPADGRGRAPGS